MCLATNWSHMLPMIGWQKPHWTHSILCCGLPRLLRPPPPGVIVVVDVVVWSGCCGCFGPWWCGSHSFGIWLSLMISMLASNIQTMPSNLDFVHALPLLMSALLSWASNILVASSVIFHSRKAPPAMVCVSQNCCAFCHSGLRMEMTFSTQWLFGNHASNGGAMLSNVIMKESKLLGTGMV